MAGTWLAAVPEKTMPKLPFLSSLLSAALVSVTLVACSSEDSAADPGGAAGSAGVGGSANTGGATNSGGTGNTGNAAGSGNSAAAGNAGGAAGGGSGGTAGLAGGCLPNKAPTESDLNRQRGSERQLEVLPPHQLRRREKGRYQGSDRPNALLQRFEFNPIRIPGGKERRAGRNCWVSDACALWR